MINFDQEQLTNLQQTLAFIPNQDIEDRCARALIKAAKGYDNLTFVKSVTLLLATIFAARPDTKEITLETAKLHADRFMMLVEMLVDARKNHQAGG
jgi:hypothetical protein